MKEKAGSKARVSCEDNELVVRVYGRKGRANGGVDKRHGVHRIAEMDA